MSLAFVAGLWRIGAFCIEENATVLTEHGTDFEEKV
jgi:hypothetical protein